MLGHPVEKEVINSALLLLATADATDDFSPMLTFMVLVGIGFALVCLGAGLLLAGLGLAILFGLLSTGALSVSVVVGLKTRSAVTGAKTFGLLLAGGLGLSGGAAGLWLLSRLLRFPVATGPALLLGGGGGAVAGLLTAWLAWWAGRRVVAYAGRTLRRH